MTPIPNDPTGKSGLVETIKHILKVLREQRIQTDPRELRIEITSRGTKISLAPGLIKGGASSSDGSVPRWG